MSMHRELEMPSGGCRNIRQALPCSRKFPVALAVMEQFSLHLQVPHTHPRTPARILKKLKEQLHHIATEIHIQWELNQDVNYNCTPISTAAPFKKSSYGIKLCLSMNTQTHEYYLAIKKIKQDHW